MASYLLHNKNLQVYSISSTLVPLSLWTLPALLDVVPLPILQD